MLSTFEDEMNNRVIIIAEDIDLRVIYALKYSKAISKDIIVFGTFSNEEDEQKRLLQWSKIKSCVPLILRYSLDRRIVETLLDFIHSNEYCIGSEEIVTVILPRLVVSRWWYRLLHNQASRYVERKLTKNRQIIVEVVPVQLDDNDSVLGIAMSS